MSNKETQFKKGKSGNPKGRPKKGETLTEILEEYLDTKEKVKDKKTRKQKLIEKAVALAMKGDLTALKYVWNRLDGLPTQSIEANIKNTIIVDIDEEGEEDA
jgi:hypothetical protein